MRQLQPVRRTGIVQVRRRCCCARWMVQNMGQKIGMTAIAARVLAADRMLICGGDVAIIHLGRA